MKARDRGRPGASYYISYDDEFGIRHAIKGYPNKAASEALKRHLEIQVDQIRRGMIDASADAIRRHRDRPLSEHLDAWEADLRAKGDTPKHTRSFTDLARRLVAVLRGGRLDDFDASRRPLAQRQAVRARLADAVAAARLPDLSAERVQAALAAVRAAGRSLSCCNHYRISVRTFTRWCWKTGRLATDALLNVSGFNEKLDRRHDRRTLSVDEVRRLIETAQHGPVHKRMTGPARALCYRLAVATGLRFSEIESLKPGSFRFGPEPAVTVVPIRTKNREGTVLPLPLDLAADLAAFVQDRPAGETVFPLPPKAGAEMLRVDLAACNIPYKDADGLFFDFHSLRCELATLADQAGVSPRIVQRMMRHSSLALTDKYTRPRAVDIAGAARALPSLVPAATGTDPVTPPCHGRVAPGHRGHLGTSRDVAGPGIGEGADPSPQGEARGGLGHLVTPAVASCGGGGGTGGGPISTRPD
jgi:integrase